MTVGKNEIIRNHAAFIWSVADLLRGDYKQSEYGKVILPLTVLRRLDCVLEPTKQKVLDDRRPPRPCLSRADRRLLGRPRPQAVRKPLRLTGTTMTSRAVRNAVGCAHHMQSARLHGAAIPQREASTERGQGVRQSRAVRRVVRR